MSRIATVVMMLAVAQPAFAQSATPPRATARFGALRPAQSNPYDKLFGAQSTPKVARDDAPKAQSPKRSVVCGLTIIEGDSAIDPKMAKTPPKHDGVAHAIRSINPPICKP